MGTDNIFHSRKASNTAALKRKAKSRERKAKFLIVCEGEKTEPNYFEGLRVTHRISSTSVSICGKECGSDPLSIVKFAEKKLDEELDDPYDEVFCVFDRDAHTTFDEALRAIATLQEQGKPIRAIISYPCFEYWVLLHYVYNRKPYARSGKKSACDVLLGEVKRHIPNYKKGETNLFKLVGHLTQNAISSAEKAKEDAKRTLAQNPSTDIHLLIRKLLPLAAL